MSEEYINDIPTDIPCPSAYTCQPITVTGATTWYPPTNHNALSFSPHVHNPDIWTNPQPPLHVLITPQEIAERVRPVVEEAVRKALHPDGLPDETRFLQVEATDRDGQKWKGTLYAVKEVEVPE